MKHLLVWVQWEDIASYHGWKGKGEYGEPIMVRSIGWLIEEGEAALKISSSVDDQANEFLTPLVIPWGCVLEYGEFIFKDGWP